MARILQQEQADIDEIENSDKDYLNELKASIAEQKCGFTLLMLYYSANLVQTIQHGDRRVQG